jgi:predicted DNA-binding WGR domain protein
MIKSSGGDLSTLESWRSGMLRDTKIAIKAGVPNIGVQIQDGIDAMAQVIDKLIAVGISVQTDSLSVGPEFALSKTVCISGKLPSGHKKTDYDSPLKAAGFLLVDEVSKGLNFLVLADAQSTSSKFERAKKLGIPVISEEQLIEMVGVAITEVQGNHDSNTLTPPMKDTQMTNERKVFQPSDQFQRFEFINEKSSKFWEVRVQGTSVDVQYGKIGTKGQALAKEFADEGAARTHAEKLGSEKQKEGYLLAANAEGNALPIAMPVAKVVPTVGLAQLVSKPVKALAPDAKPFKTLCISGKLPSGKKKADYEEALRSVGITLVDDVIHGLSYLVLADPTSDSSKAVKARKLGVAVIAEAQLIQIVG